MPAIQEITDKLIRDNIQRAVHDVFKTMLGHQPDFVSASVQLAGVHTPAMPAAAENSHPSVVGTVGFLGDVNGLIYLYFDVAFARLATGQLLSMSDAELDDAGDEVVNDAIGELTNMTVGSFKNGLCDAGYPCKLTIPSILRGSNFCVEPISSAVRHTFYFNCAGHRVVTDILMKIGD